MVQPDRTKEALAHLLPLVKSLGKLKPNAQAFKHVLDLITKKKGLNELSKLSSSIGFQILAT